jgi:hypothetical protein
MNTVLRLLSLVTIAFALAASRGFAQTVGDSEEAVRRTLGEPNLAREVGERKIWMYPDGTKIVLEGGVVVESTAPSPVRREAPVERQVERTRNTKPHAATTSRPEQRSRPKPRPQLDDEPSEHSGVAALFLIAGMLVLVVCGIINIIAAFSESVLWGLGVMFVPLVGLFFLILHWDKAKKPFLVSLLVGLPLMFLGGLIQGASGSM